MSLLSKLTLIVTTYNRPRFAMRIMRYWSGSEVTVRVLDGSKERINAEELHFLLPNVEYHHLPVPLLERLNKSSELIKTDYVAWLFDDEFYLPSGLEACLKELEADSSLVSCIGRTLAFRPNSGKIAGWPDYTVMKNYAVTDEDPVQRMISHMNPYVNSTICSLVRSEVWKRAMAIPCQHQFSVFAMLELEIELAVSYAGKSKAIENLMWLRSYENNGIRDEHDIVQFPDWWADPGKKPEHEKLLGIMADALSEPPVDHDLVKDGVRHALDAYYRFVKRVKPQRKKDMGYYLDKFISRNTKRIKSKLKAIGIKVASPENAPDTLLQSAARLARTGVHVNFNELTQVNALIAEFHNGPGEPASHFIDQSVKTN